MDTFAYADSLDESSGRYLGLRCGQQAALAPDAPGLMVKPDIAARQLAADLPDSDPGDAVASTPPTPQDDRGPQLPMPPATEPHSRYHGTVRLNAMRVGQDASQVAEEVIAYLVGLAGAEVTVTIDIETRLQSGASEQVVRTVTENGRTLKFEQGSGFERD